MQARKSKGEEGREKKKVGPTFSLDHVGPTFERVRWRLLRVEFGRVCKMGPHVRALVELNFFGGVFEPTCEDRVLVEKRKKLPLELLL